MTIPRHPACSSIVSYNPNPPSPSSLLFLVLCLLLSFFVVSPFLHRSLLRTLQLCRSGHHPREPDTHTLDNRQQHRASDRAVSHGLVSSSHRQTPAGEEAGYDGVVWVFLLSDPSHRAVECGEETAPDAKVAAEHGGSHLDGCDGADSSLAVGAISKTFDAVPDCAADCLKYTLVKIVMVLMMGMMGRNIHPWQRLLQSH